MQKASNRFYVKVGLILLSILLIWLAHSFVSSFYLGVINLIGIYAILALSYNLINGVAGQFSLEPNGFVAIGAYMTALFILPLDTKVDMFALADPAPIILQMKANFPIALLAGGLASAFIALMLSIPVFRVRGDYLAIVTLGFGFIIRIFAMNSPSYTNGAMGLNDIPELANIYWIGGIVIITFITMINIIYSRFGRAMKAVRDDEDAATAMGINTFKIKTFAFMTSAFFEGIGGGLLAAYYTVVGPDQFTFLLTFYLLIIIVLGGLGSMTGTLISAILIGVGLEWLRFLDDEIDVFGIHFDAHPGMRMVIFSVILIIVMLKARKGLFGNKELFDLFTPKKKSNGGQK